DYVDRLTAELTANGMAPTDARRAAIAQTGKPPAVREHVRSSGWEHVVETTLADVRYALRRLRHNPGFTIVATLTLAISIGATTAIFSAVNPILLRPLPYPGADRLVTIADRRDDGSPFDPTYGTYVELAARARSFAMLAASDGWTPSISGTTTEPERLAGRRVSATFLHTLGVAPLAGRGFDASEDQPGGPNVAIVSDRLVRRRFAGDAAVGRTITLDGDVYTVIGVMPSDFVDPVASATDIWAPLQVRAHAPFNSREWGHHYRILGRIAPNVDVAQAAREVAAIGAGAISEFPRPSWSNMSSGMVIRSLQNDITANARPALLAIVGAVFVLLAIACVNVTNLLLARGAQRRGEFAMRSALGAGRGRVLRQLLTESVILAMIGGVVGLIVAAAGVRALVILSPPGLPRIEAVRFDVGVFAFAVALTTLVGLVIGLMPAVVASRAGLNHGAQGLSRRTVGGRAAARNVLVVAEVALAIVLLVGAGLLARSLNRLFGVAPGFNPSHMLSMQVVESGHAYHTDTARARAYTEALDAVRRVPGVVDAAFTSQLPLSGSLDSYGYELAAYPAAKPGDDGSTGAFRYQVTPDYFRTMGIPLRRGRLFDATDRVGAPESIIISQSFANRKFGHMNPIGQRTHFGPEVNGDHPWGTVVGVVGDMKQESLGGETGDGFYVPMGQWWWVDNDATLVVRTSGDPAPLTAAIKRAIWSVDPTQPILRIATMDQVIAATASQRRFAAIVFQAFAFTALLLAAIGLYGVIAGSVTERTREIGIRTALGATSGNIVAGVVGNGLLLTTVGVLFGISGAFVASRMLETLLFGVTRGDPSTYVGVVGLVAGVAVLACWGPAKRAARVDPAITLRAE